MSGFGLVSPTFGEVFHQLDPMEDTPKFRDLLRLPIGPRHTLASDELTDEQLLLVHGCLDSIAKICAAFGYTPLILDLSLIIDERVSQVEGTEPFYHGFLRFDVEAGNDVWAAYQDAVYRARHEDESYEAIVTHPEFFSPRNAFFWWSGRTLPEGVAPIRLPPPIDRGIAQTYRFNVLPIETHSQSVERNLEVFLNNLSDTLTEHVGPNVAETPVEFLGVPIIRSHFRTAGELGKEHVAGTPGGAAFLFLRNENEHDDEQSLQQIMELARSISWLLARAAVDESFAAVDVQKKREELLRRSMDAAYSVAHPLKHRLGALLTGLRELDDDHRSGTAIEENIEILLESATAVKGFAELAYLLHFAVAEGAANVRSKRSDGEFKFVTTGTYDFWRIFCDMRSSARLGKTLFDKVELTADADFHPLVESFLIDAPEDTVPLRLVDVVYEQMAFEVLNNVVAHGAKRHGSQTRPVSVGYEPFGKHGAMGIVFENHLKKAEELPDIEKEWNPWPSPSPSGLTFVSNVLRATDSGEVFVRSDRDRNTFSIALVLRGLRNA